MTNEQIKQEFSRWIEAGRPAVHVRGTNKSWYTNSLPNWDGSSVYVVDDEHAELRMLQIDKPETKFEKYYEYGGTKRWKYTKNPIWLIECEYRVLQELKIDTKVMVWDNEDEEKTKRYFSHFEDEIIYCFGVGKTEWSSNNGATTFWDNWELADD